MLSSLGVQKQTEIGAAHGGNSNNALGKKFVGPSVAACFFVVVSSIALYAQTVLPRWGTVSHVATALLRRKFPPTGLVLFFGSLYLYSYTTYTGVGADRRGSRRHPCLMASSRMTLQVEKKVLEMAQHASFHQHVSYNLSTILHGFTAGNHAS